MMIPSKRQPPESWWDTPDYPIGDYTVPNAAETATRPLKGWWTVLASLGVVVIGQLQTWDWTTLVTPQNAGMIVTGLGVLMAVLRFLTTGPVGEKGPPPGPKA